MSQGPLHPRREGPGLQSMYIDIRAIISMVCTRPGTINR